MRGGNDVLGKSGNSEKEQQKIASALQKYGIESLRSDEDYNSAVAIMQTMAGTGLGAIGADLTQLGGGNSEKANLNLIRHYERAIFEQNWIIIRQLDRIAAALEGRQ